MVSNIVLDSSLAKLQRGGERNVSHDFTRNFQPPILLGPGKYKAALNKVITMSYTWYNIDASYGNNKIRWRKKTEEWQTLIFDVNSFLQTQTGKVDPKDKDSDFIFTLYFDMTIFRVVILMHENYELDLSEGEFAKLLGYEKKILTGKKNFVGAMVPDITRSVDWVFLHCDLISWQAHDVPSDVLYSVSTSGLRVSYPFKEEPYRLEWHPVNTSMINSIRIWVTGQ